MKINFEKIRNYNQLLLSIAGTGLILFFFLGGLWTIYEEYRRYKYNSNDLPSGIIAQEETNQLLEDSTRRQIISFNQIGLIDSVSELFILPVTQENLDDLESIDESLGIINGMTSGSFNYKKYRRYNDGTFNNIVLYNAKKNQSDIIFKSRTSINNYRVERINGSIYLLITGTSIDTNKDKFLNSKDLQELFVYSVSKEELSKIQLNEDYSTLQILRPSKSKKLFGKFGLDRNQDGIFNLKKEPTVFKRINLEESKLLDVIQDNQVEMLQRLLEGR